MKVEAILGNCKFTIITSTEVPKDELYWVDIKGRVVSRTKPEDFSKDLDVIVAKEEL